jgi:diacylglycerol kinase family enzyme
MTYLLIYNPKSGKGKIQKDLPKIKTFFKEKNLSLDIHETVSRGCKKLCCYIKENI